ncbi:hypothetical protein [Candidatus Nitrotoga sp. BS]|nr:hypothetical protein [Candidatus Nitrotoga sp. BS]
MEVSRLAIINLLILRQALNEQLFICQFINGLRNIENHKTAAKRQ